MAHQELSPEQDFHAWALNAAQRARAGLLTPQELEQVAEELEDRAKSERRELKNRLAVLLAHLLKWQYQPDARSYSWEGTINGQRSDLDDLLEDNPSLRPELPAYLEKAYQRGIQKAVEETNMNKRAFPSTFSETGWTLEQVLAEDCFPD
ncbi:DUF29 domain-containing protein [Nitrosococcus wardiae]|uniref:DUF29 domain-containing protein n=1 Tax=Nitrosococcus wardiae TaxID=1814290 RepID=A0A4P7BVR0_9GAMM|nr:DUF29 domain-containing protein [Nitrosococcus wardiae]QBQ54001.1 DUF29 domain-containing protein [Nitrosococcus wardiae]